MHLFWPDVDTVRGAAWNGEVAWDRGPTWGDVVIALRPALRALFLQGYRTRSIRFFVGPAVTGPLQWQLLDLETLALSSVIPAHAPGANGLDVLFDVEPLVDASGSAPGGYDVLGVPTRLGFDDAPPPSPLPDPLVQSVEAFADEAIERLADLVHGGVAPRADHQGLLWIFAADRVAGTSIRAGFEGIDGVYQLLTGDPAGFIRDQVYERREGGGLIGRERTRPPAPDLCWLLERVPRPLSIPHPMQLDVPDDLTLHPNSFWEAVRSWLEDRGESERLTMRNEGRLRGENGPSWLDVLVELIGRGVLPRDGLVRAMDPVEPLVVQRIPGDVGGGTPDAIQLDVWGETTVKLERVLPTVHRALSGGYATGVDGSVAWEYVRNPGDRPRVVVVASRGIQVTAPEAMDHYPWVLDLYRVQDDALVPPAGSAIDPLALLGPSTLYRLPGEVPYGAATAAAAVIARGKKDGLFLEFPPVTWGEPPFVVELTLSDPRSGHDGYVVDVHHYAYPFAANVPEGMAAHVCVWATSGVDIHSNGVAAEDSQEAYHIHNVSRWKASAEFWQLDTLEHVGFPFAEVLSVTPRLTLGDAGLVAASVPRFDDGDGARSFDVGGDPQRRVSLTPKQFTRRTYNDSFYLLLVDIGIGLIPGVGDVADISELAIALTMGTDRWGRPVTNFDIALMAAGCAVPFVSSAFTRGVGAALTAPVDDILRGTELTALFRRMAPPVSAAPDPTFVERAAGESPTWNTGANWRLGARADAVSALMNFLQASGGAVEAFARRICSETRESWLVLEDIYDSSVDHFRIAAINDEYRRWQGRNAGEVDPQRFLASLNESSRARGAAKILADALLGPENVARGGRLAPQRARMASECGRPEIQGPGHRIEELDYDDDPNAALNFFKTARDFIDGALRPGSTIRVVESYALRLVTDVVEEVDRAFLTDAVQMLGDLIRRAEVEPNDVVGASEIGRWPITMQERSARFATALFVAVAEMRSRGFDPRWLLGPELLPELRAFVRQYIMRNGFEIGMRFELTKATEFVRVLAGHANVEFVRTQLRMPVIGGLATYLQSGPDLVLYVHDQAQDLRRAVFVQLKAYTNLDNLAVGSWRFFTDADGNLRFRGPDFVQQAVSDALRLDHPDWQGSVPGPGELESTAPDQIRDWVRTANVHVLMFDDALVRDMVLQLVLEARTRTGRATTVAADLIDASPQVQETFGRMFPNGLAAGTGDDAAELVQQTLYQQDGWLDAWATALEADINRFMDEQFFDVYGERLHFLVRRANADPGDIVEAVMALIPTLE